MDNIEQEIQAKGLTAPRVTLADLESRIVSEYYFTAAEGALGAALRANKISLIGGEFEPTEELPPSLGLLTICVLVLANGFTVTSESACASPENFDAKLGRKIARANAVNKIWPLEGYLLKQRLSLPPIENHQV